MTLSLKRWMAASLVLGLGSVHAIGIDGTEWKFQVLLDDKPIGLHRFVVREDGRMRTVLSEADFSVKFLGLTAYRYRHRATEQWDGECLTRIESTTDDDGKSMHVSGRRDGNELTLVAGEARQSVEGCVMSFAYWNPAFQTQSRLLNDQTGKVETVQVRRMGSSMIEVHGERRVAEQLRILGPSLPIDVWYSGQGDWLGLDAVVSGGHRLSYRLP